MSYISLKELPGVHQVLDDFVMKNKYLFQTSHEELNLGKEQIPFSSSDSYCKELLRKEKIDLDKGKKVEDSLRKTYLSSVAFREYQSSLPLSKPFDCRVKIDKALCAMSMANSDVIIMKNECALLRRDHEKMGNKVKILSGGRSGHEPLFYEYVGRGMLTAAITGKNGNVPFPHDILRVIKELTCQHKGGILLIIMNYIEDRLNFGAAMELAKTDGIEFIDLLIVNDDSCEFISSTVGRKGLSGIIPIIKIIGAMSEAGKSFQSIYTICNKLIKENICTISCNISDTVRIGTDIDAEGGTLGKGINCFKSLITSMLDFIFHPLKYHSFKVNENEKYILIVSSYTMSSILLYSSTLEIISYMSRKNLNISNIFAGTFVTGFPGISITIIRDDNYSQWLNIYTKVSVWPRNNSLSIPTNKNPLVYINGDSKIISPTYVGPWFSKEESNVAFHVLCFTCATVIANQFLLNELSKSDYGINLARGSYMIMEELINERLKCSTPYNMLNQIGVIIRKSVLGITGIIYWALFTGAGQAFIRYVSDEPINTNIWSEALESAFITLKAYVNNYFSDKQINILHVLKSCAKIGRIQGNKKTTNRWQKNIDSDLSKHWLKCVVETAEDICDSTKNESNRNKSVNCPDFMCQTVAIIFRAIYTAIRGNSSIDNWIQERQLWFEKLKNNQKFLDNLTNNVFIEDKINSKQLWLNSNTKTLNEMLSIIIEQ